MKVLSKAGDSEALAISTDAINRVCTRVMKLEVIPLPHLCISLFPKRLFWLMGSDFSLLHPTNIKPLYTLCIGRLTHRHIN